MGEIQIECTKDIPGLKYSKLDGEEVKLLITVFNNTNDQEMFNDILETTVGKFVNGKINSFNLTNKVNLNTALGLSAGFNLLIPGQIVLMLIDLVNFYDKYQKEATMLDAFQKIYPMGFYNEDSFIKIVDEYLKSKRLKNSEIY